jgi:hypothetical protein
MPYYVKKSISMQAVEDNKVKQAAAAALDCILIYCDAHGWPNPNGFSPGLTCRNPGLGN